MNKFFELLDELEIAEQAMDYAATPELFAIACKEYNNVKERLEIHKEKILLLRGVDENVEPQNDSSSGGFERVFDQLRDWWKKQRDNIS